MFFKLALKNIKRSLKDYAIYFFTLVLGVAIFYIFNAIESQTVMLNIDASMLDIVDLMTNILSGVSVFVAFVLGFLILYASRFLIKRRSKEFGLYLTLGMGKRKISSVLLIETFLIGLISLAVGLLVGIILSQFTSVLVANLFEADMTNFTFVFSASACLKTIICFALIYLVVMIFNTVNINRQKLINLLSGARQSEKIKVKNPWLCTIIFCIAVAMLAWAYYAVTGGVETVLLQNEYMVFLVLATGGVATFLLFWSLSGLLLRIFMSWKSVYYHKLNSFTLRQFSSKINTTVFSMTMICLMLFVTICVFSSAMSIRNSMNIALKQNMPMDVEFHRRPHWDEESNQYHILGDSKDIVYQTFQQQGLNLDEVLGETIEFRKYALQDLTMAQTVGSLASQITAQFPYVDLDGAETVIRVSDYNKIAKIFGNPELSLTGDEYAVVADYQQAIDQVRNPALAAGTKITINGKTLKPKYSQCQIGAAEMSPQSNINTGLFVVPDSLKLGDDAIERWTMYGKYADGIDKAAVEEKIIDYSLHGVFFEDSYLYVETRQASINNNIGLSALATFIGLYLGMIFLISSAAILALKELSESTDNRQKFNMLRKIGASEKMLNRALFWQIGIFFGFPLLIAIVHSVFGIMFCSYILVSFGNMDLLKSILLTAALIVVIYGGYFLITYFCSKNIIRERRA